MTDPRDYLADVLAKADAATPGPWESYGDLDHEVFANWPDADEAPYIAHSITRGNDSVFIASARSTSPAMARALLAVLDLLDKPMYEGDLPAVVDAIRAAITTELAKEIEHG